jgi:amino acid adenylation domain-containing protein
VTTLSPPRGLVADFISSVERFPERPAVDVGGEAVSYDELHRRASSIAAALETNSPADARLTAVFAARGSTAYAAILGALFRGHGYVPLNSRYPAERNREILERSGCTTLVVDDTSIDAALATVAGIRKPLHILLADGAHSPASRRRFAPHEAFVVSDGYASSVDVRTDDPAYLLFTSGSTGRPKGVLVRQSNVRAFLDGVGARFGFDERDRFSQMFDLTFDLSAFDLFAAWASGACVCTPRPAEELKPSDFIRAAGITVWFSVPSVAMILQRFRVLRPGAFRTLRLSLFCGEALPAALATAWAAAAPESAVENLYGPTEATIACTAHRFTGAEVAGLVPIGSPLGRTRVRVVDESLRETAPGEPGELLLAGPQVVDGYFDDEVATARAFVDVPGLGHAYRTGDRAVVTPDGELAFLGRLDSQVKVLGHRVELEEVEATIREESGADAIAVGWPRTEVGAAGIVALVAGSIVPGELRARLAARLPEYMVPREIRIVDELPLNANGKRDRRAAAAILGEE